MIAQSAAWMRTLAIAIAFTALRELGGAKQRHGGKEACAHTILQNFPPVIQAEVLSQPRHIKQQMVDAIQALPPPPPGSPLHRASSFTAGLAGPLSPLRRPSVTKDQRNDQVNSILVCHAFGCVQLTAHVAVSPCECQHSRVPLVRKRPL